MLGVLRTQGFIGLFGFALAAAFWPGQSGAAENSRWALLAIAVPAVLFVCKIKPNAVNILLGLALGWASLSILWSDVPWDSYDNLFKMALTAGCIVIGAQLTDLKWFYWGIAIGMLVNTAIAIPQAFHYYPVVAVMPGGIALPSGLFVNPSMLGEACAPLVMVLLARREWIWAGTALVPLLLSQNRAGTAAVVLCGIVFLLQELRWKGLIGIAVLAVPAWFIFNKGVDPFSSVSQRWDIWDGAVRGLTTLGHGIGQFYADFPIYSTAVDNENSPTWVMTAHAHNDILEFAFELGLPGVILLGTLAWIVCRRAERPERYGLAAICLTAMVGFPWHMPFTAAMGAIMAGYATRDRGVVRRSKLHSGSHLHGWRKYFGFEQAAGGSAHVPV
jgi:O-Antigen ligase